MTSLKDYFLTKVSTSLDNEQAAMSLNALHEIVGSNEFPFVNIVKRSTFQQGEDTSVTV